MCNNFIKKTPSVLWHCFVDDRENIRNVKKHILQQSRNILLRAPSVMTQFLEIIPVKQYHNSSFLWLTQITDFFNKYMIGSARSLSRLLSTQKASSLKGNYHEKSYSKWTQKLT